MKMDRWNLKKIVAFILVVLLFVSTSFDGHLKLGTAVWAGPLSPENAITVSVSGEVNNVFLIDGHYYIACNANLYKVNFDEYTLNSVFIGNSLIPELVTIGGMHSIIGYGKVGNSHRFLIGTYDSKEDRYYISTVSSTNMINFTAPLKPSRISVNVNKNIGATLYTVGSTYILIYESINFASDGDIQTECKVSKSTNLVDWTNIISPETMQADSQSDIKFSNPIDSSTSRGIFLEYTKDYYSENDGDKEWSFNYNFYSWNDSGYTELGDYWWKYEWDGNTSRNRYYTNSDYSYEGILENFGDFAFMHINRKSLTDHYTYNAPWITSNRTSRVYYGTTALSLGYTSDLTKYNDGGVYSKKVDTAGKYLYYIDNTAEVGTFKLKRLDGSTMTSTDLKTLSNYVSHSKLKANDEIYLKVNLSTGSQYFKIANGSISNINAAAYNEAKKLLPIVTPDDEYKALDYVKKYADKDLAIFYSIKNKAVKIIRNNTAPELTVTTPSENAFFGKQHTAVVPQISVSDTDNNALTCKYFIDGVQKETKTIASNTSTPQTVSFTAVNIGALSEDVHKMKFEVTDGFVITEATIDFIVDKTPPNIASLTVTSTANSITVTGSASDATAGMGDNTYPPYNYTVTVGTSNLSSGWTTENPFIQESLQPNRNYAIKLEARDRVGNIGERSITAYTKAAIPTLTVRNITTNTMDIQINDSNPANTQYSIAAGTKYVSSSGALTSTEQWIALTNKRIKATGLAPNTPYKITAKARNSAGEATLQSAEVEGMTLPTAPENITAQPDKYFITLTWSAMPYISKYEVSADGEIESTGTETAYIHDYLIPNTQHSYKVRAVNAGGDGLWSDILTAATLPDPPGIPINLRAEASQNEITLEWDAVEGAIDYDVEADGDLEEGITGTTYIHSGLLSNTPHTYKVRARNRGGVGEWSDLLNKDTLPDPPGIPEGIEVTGITKDTITLTWNTSDRAEGYDIEADGVIIDSTTDITYTHIGLAADTEYIYRIRARNIGGESEWTEETIARTLPEKPSIPNNLTATAGTNEISLSWDNAERAAEYDVEADGELIATITGTSYIHEGLAPDTQHTYRVKARNIGGESDSSAMVTAYTLSETTGMALTNVAAVVTNTSITLMWDAVAADTEYDVEVDGEIKDNEKNTTYIHSALQPVTSHTYKIRPKRGEEKGPWCAVLAISTLPNPPDAPDNIKAIVTNTTIQLMWDEEEGATGYDIEIDGNDVVSTTGTMYIHEGLIPGTQHSYRIRAVNIAGATQWSQAIEKSTIKPTYMIEAEAGEEYHIALAAMGMQEFKGRKLVLEYNPIEVEILDLCEETRGIELENGRIPGTNIIINHIAGRIEIEADRSIEPGKAWTGVLSTILIRSKADGVINLDYLAE
jgi:hypothetical protein